VDGIGIASGTGNNCKVLMSGPADVMLDPIFVLESCLQERSGGSMIASLRDVWRMARLKSFDGSYIDALNLLASTGRYHLAAGIDEPVMIRPNKSLGS